MRTRHINDAHVKPYQTGTLPDVGFLANTYVPKQQPGRQYTAADGLMVGTLFPGLDLPFMGKTNSRKVTGPAAEVMTLGFAVHELGLYLDLHPSDCEALELFNAYASQLNEAKRKYEEKHGPLSMKSGGGDEYTWAKMPWPWDMSRGG